MKEAHRNTVKKRTLLGWLKPVLSYICYSMSLPSIWITDIVKVLQLAIISPPSIALLDWFQDCSQTAVFQRLFLHNDCGEEWNRAFFSLSVYLNWPPVTRCRWTSPLKETYSVDQSIVLLFEVTNWQLT